MKSQPVMHLNLQINPFQQRCTWIWTGSIAYLCLKTNISLLHKYQGTQNVSQNLTSWSIVCDPTYVYTLCVCIYVFIWILYEFIYICVFVCAYVWIHLHMYTCIYVSMYVFLSLLKLFEIWKRNIVPKTWKPPPNATTCNDSACNAMTVVAHFNQGHAGLC